MYLQIDEGFVAHPKTKLFAGKMQDPNAAMYLIKLWTWAVRSSPAGDLTEMNPWSIEETVGYRLLDGKCYAAMVACGFIDEVDAGAPKCIHNWAKRTGGDIVKMENEAGRRRLLRAHNANKCDAATCPFHRRADDPPPDESKVSADCQPDIQPTAARQSADDLHQGKARPVQARSESAPPLSAPMRSDPDQTGARSTASAKLWTVHEWRDRFGRAWAAKYQTIAYGDAGDTKACVALGFVLDALPPAERLAAQAKAPEMFAEFLANVSPTVVNRRHPFVFFAQEWGGLRVARQATAPPKPPDKPWVAAEKADEERKARERMESRKAMQELTRKLADDKAVAS